MIETHNCTLAVGVVVFRNVGNCDGLAEGPELGYNVGDVVGSE